jgi:hypothetical protein
VSFVTEPSHAVFLSYALQVAEPARRQLRYDLAFVDRKHNQ